MMIVIILYCTGAAMVCATFDVGKKLALKIFELGLRQYRAPFRRAIFMIRRAKLSGAACNYFFSDLDN